ncbi:hypothetical protein Javan254_0037 [Streptococcus phage Javan254]|nr:hypothetical protein Javan254_0037 [Streptococcus phage Javan254]
MGLSMKSKKGIPGIGKVQSRLENIILMVENSKQRKRQDAIPLYG